MQSSGRWWRSSTSPHRGRQGGGIYRSDWRRRLRNSGVRFIVKCWILGHVIPMIDCEMLLGFSVPQAVVSVYHCWDAHSLLKLCNDEFSFPDDSNQKNIDPHLLPLRYSIWCIPLFNQIQVSLYKNAVKLMCCSNWEQPINNKRTKIFAV
jgi:hypothetical protein